MTLVTILGDGSTIPVLRKNDLLVCFIRGTIEVGKYSRKNFCGALNYLDTPQNNAMLGNELYQFIETTFPALLLKKHAIHFLCPPEIVKKAVWHEAL